MSRYLTDRPHALLIDVTVLPSGEITCPFAILVLPGEEYMGETKDPRDGEMPGPALAKCSVLPPNVIALRRRSA
jgi:hypothetical protein